MSLTYCDSRALGFEAWAYIRDRNLFHDIDWKGWQVPSFIIKKRLV